MTVFGSWSCTSLNQPARPAGRRSTGFRHPGRTPALDGWDEATLLGALLEVREGAADLRNGPSHLARWKASGGKALTAEKGSE